MGAYAGQAGIALGRRAKVGLEGINRDLVAAVKANVAACWKRSSRARVPRVAPLAQPCLCSEQAGKLLRVPDDAYESTQTLEIFHPNCALLARESQRLRIGIYL
jgi:hypothetical protein